MDVRKVLWGEARRIYKIKFYFPFRFSIVWFSKSKIVPTRNLKLFRSEISIYRCQILHSICKKNIHSKVLFEVYRSRLVKKSILLGNLQVQYTKVISIKKKHEFRVIFSVNFSMQGKVSISYIFSELLKPRKC